MVPTLLGIPGKLGNSQISLPVGKKSGNWLIITEIREIVTENWDKIVFLAKKHVPPFRRVMNQGNTEINRVNEIESYKCQWQKH